MKKVLAAVLAASMALSMGVSSIAKDANEYTLVIAGTNTADDEGTFVDVDCVWAKDDGKTQIGEHQDSFNADEKLYIQLSVDATTTAALAKYTDLTDDDLWKISFKKGDNSKIIKSIKLVENTVNRVRKPMIEIKFNEDMTDTEYKMNPEITIKPKGDVAKIGGITDTVITAKFYFKNVKDETDDRTYSAGQKGYVYKPTKNEDNTVTWEDNNNDIAMLEFTADSDTSVAYPKLSTMWNNADYAEVIGDMDAYLFDFVGHPSISSTSRPVLTIYNPFIDDDDEMTVSEEDIVVYQVNDDGSVDDVTAQFTIGENDDGDSVLVTKTRTLGTYIVAAQGLEGATTPDAEPVPDDGKEIPNTGR